MNIRCFSYLLCKGTKNILYTQYLICKNGAKSFLFVVLGVFVLELLYFGACCEGRVRVA